MVKEKAKKSLTVLGLMSGTTFDGVDAAIIKTDGEKIIEVGKTLYATYPEFFREKYRNLISNGAPLKNILEIEDEITLFHSKVANDLIKISKLNKDDVDLIAFHGQTIFHDAKISKTWQLANGSLLSEETGVNVMCDFRRRDLAKGGEGAPLVPLFNRALAQNIKKPVAFLNIGGVSNVTFIDENDQLLAFDTGPGCALIDDWVNMRLQKSFDKHGDIARSGTCNQGKVDYFIEYHRYFQKKPPKSLDRNEFHDALRKVSAMNTADGAATLTHFTARSIYESSKLLPQTPQRWIVSGGGRHNKFLIELLRVHYQMNIELIDSINFGKFKLSGDFIEAQAFAFLGARCFYNMSITDPTTTGAIQPASGGAFYQA